MSTLLNNFYKKVHFLLNQRYKVLIISSGTVYN